MSDFLLGHTVGLLLCRTFLALALSLVLVAAMADSCAPMTPMEEDSFEEAQGWMLELLVLQLDLMKSPMRRMETHRPQSN